MSGPEDPAALQAIADALAVPGPDGVAATAAWIDWDQFVDFVAATVVVGQYDGYPWHSPGDDAFVWFDPASGRMTTLPHSLDETFVRDDHDPFSGHGLLLRTCLESPTCADDYVTSIWDAQATAARFDLAQYARDVQAQIASLAVADPARPYTVDEIVDAQADLIDFVVDRSEHLTALIGGQ